MAGSRTCDAGIKGVRVKLIHGTVLGLRLLHSKWISWIGYKEPKEDHCCCLAACDKLCSVMALSHANLLSLL